MISRRYPTAEVFNLVGPLARSSMYLDTSDPFQADVAYGAYQPSIIDAILRLAQPDDVVITAGANLGYVALALAQAVGHGGKVLAFEADPRAAEICRQNLELNKTDTVQLFPFALGAENGELEMLLSSTLGQSSFAIGHHHFRSEQVPVRKGDEALAELGTQRIDGLVLDVEGWEMQVLAGLSKTFAAHLPRWAIVECWDVALRATGSSGSELKRELKDLGWNTAPLDSVEEADDGDIVCVRANSHSANRASACAS